MIVLSEQYGYREPKSIPNVESFIEVLNKQHYSKSIQKRDSSAYCYKIIYSGDTISPYNIETSYFVGVDWIVEKELSIHVTPKLDKGSSEVNYLKMLFEILEIPENYEHLDQLFEIDFEKATIPIEQSQDLLTPLLLVQYLNILKKIVQKGLKKSYYNVIVNFNSRIKGKILINETIKKNHFNNKILFNYCQYTEFGINSIENKVLKKALSFSIAALQNLRGIDSKKIAGLLNFIQPAFTGVDNEVSINDLKEIKSNKLYKEYAQALKFAKYILKRYGYNISTTSSVKVKTPPFWIDMSKLFELYVFSKLKERFVLHNEVTYHKKFNYLEPDFIVKTNDGVTKIIVDAKYKPRYEDGNIMIEDIRQIAGYARLEKIYEFLDIDKEKVIDCLVIYSNQNVNRKDFKEDFELEKLKEYNKFYKIGIELPVKDFL